MNNKMNSKHDEFHISINKTVLYNLTLRNN